MRRSPCWLRRSTRSGSRRQASISGSTPSRLSRDRLADSNELLWIGGGEAGGLEPAMRRLGRFGAGWIVNPRLPFEEIPAALARAEDEARAAGRGEVRFGVDLNVQWHEGDDVAAVVARRRAAGATRLSVFLGGLDVTESVDELIARATSFATAAGLRARKPFGE